MCVWGRWLHWGGNTYILPDKSVGGNRVQEGGISGEKAHFSHTENVYKYFTSPIDSYSCTRTYLRKTLPFDYYRFTSVYSSVPHARTARQPVNLCGTLCVGAFVDKTYTTPTRRWHPRIGLQTFPSFYLAQNTKREFYNTTIIVMIM